MTPEQRREIARKGGKAAHAKGTAHQFTPEEAREAGRKGGQALVRKGGSKRMAELGRLGGLNRNHKGRKLSDIVSVTVKEPVTIEPVVQELTILPDSQEEPK